MTFARRCCAFALCAILASGGVRPSVAADPLDRRAQMFHSADANGDGKVSFDEFVAFEKAQRQARRERAIAHAADPNASDADKERSARGKAAAARYDALSDEEKTARYRRAFDRRDTDHDGSIDSTEWSATTYRVRDAAPGAPETTSAPANAPPPAR